MTNQTMLREFDIATAEGQRGVIAIASSGIEPVSEDRVSYCDVVRHAVRTGINELLTDVDWLRLNIQSNEVSSATVDIRSICGADPKDILRQEHDFTIVNRYDPQHNREQPGLHVLSGVFPRFTLARYALPHEVQLIYPYESFHSVQTPDGLKSARNIGRNSYL